MLYVGMYVCIYVCMYVMYLPMYVYIYVCIYVSIYVCIYVYMYVCMYVYVFMYNYYTRCISIIIIVVIFSYSQWINSWSVVSQLNKGILRQWRRKVIYSSTLDTSVNIFINLRYGRVWPCTILDRSRGKRFCHI